MDFKDIEKLIKLKRTCDNIMKNPECIDDVKELKFLIQQVNKNNLQNIHHIVVCAFYPILKKTAENKTSFSQNIKSDVIEALNVLFNKIRIDRLEIFLNIYGFLLNEIYDPKAKSCVAAVNEEYKLLILECTISLAKCLSWDVVTDLYTKEHAPKLCQILYVALEIAKLEQLRKLRITAIQCIMTLARIHDNCDEGDVVLQAQVADVFIFFFPGIASGLKDIALEDEKFGHGVVVEALKAFGGLVKSIMYKPNGLNEESNAHLDINIKNLIQKNEKQTDQKNSEKCWKNEKEIKKYLENMERDIKWFKETDSKLQFVMKTLTKLTHHSHPKVREELGVLCAKLTKHCSNTIPLTMCYISEILIVLSEDEYEMVSKKAKKALSMLSEKFSSDKFKTLLENLEEKFYATICILPRIFITLDQHQQIGAANMLVGYLRIFDKNNLTHILHSPAHLKRLIFTLISITKMETNQLTQLEDYVQDVFDSDYSCLPDYKKFKYLQNQKIVSKLELACTLLAVEGVVDVVVDSLLNLIRENEDNIKEGIYILNQVLTGLRIDRDIHIIENVIKVYLDSEYWNLPLRTIDKDGNKYSLGEIQGNVLQICLLVEGLGKIALTLGSEVDQFLLKILYPILEKAGSPQPLVRRAGLVALKNLATACQYHNTTDLINDNDDYISFHIMRKIQKVEKNESVLNVLCVIMQHSNIEVLQSISDIIRGILIQTCDKYFQEQKANPYLHIFKTFIHSLMRWLHVKPMVLPIKSKKEKEKEMEDFKVMGVKEMNNFGDEIMGKTAEEMFKEDLQKSQKELMENCGDHDTNEEYKQPESPMHIKLTVAILKRCVHFLPAKDRMTRLVVLEILKSGLEIIRDWEDELLPLVHQIWSPLVNRFNETEELVIVNYSFQLLVTLSRLSKYFIRSRTEKEILPNLLKTLDKLCKESYLKDKGSPYRYTQAYKLQLTILTEIGKLVTDLDMEESHINLVSISIFPYLSDRQPIPLQELALNYFRDLIMYDKESISKTIPQFLKKQSFDKSEFIKGKILIRKLL